MLGEHLVLVMLYCRLQLVWSKTNRIGGTKYHIYCSLIILLYTQKGNPTTLLTTYQLSLPKQFTN